MVPDDLTLVSSKPSVLVSFLTTGTKYLTERKLRKSLFWLVVLVHFGGEVMVTASSTASADRKWRKVNVGVQLIQLSFFFLFSPQTQPHNDAAHI